MFGTVLMIVHALIDWDAKLPPAAESAPFPTDLICVYQVALRAQCAVLFQAMKPSLKITKNPRWLMIDVYIGVEPKIGVGFTPPKSSHVVRRAWFTMIFTIHFGGFTIPIFGLTPIYINVTQVHMSPSF